MGNQVSARRRSQAPVKPEPVVEPEEHEEEAEDEEVHVSQRMIELREEALQQEVEFNDDHTEEELSELIETVKAKRLADEQAEAESISSSVKLLAEQQKQQDEEPKPRKRKGPPVRKPMPHADLCKLWNLPSPTPQDYALADQHDYPVVVPGGKAYQISIEIRCPLSGQDRPMGSIMLMTDYFASNKTEYLKPV